MKICKIVSPPPDNDLAAKAFGTEVFCDGHKMHGIATMSVTWNPGDLIIAEMELYVWPGTIEGAATRFYIQHPFDGGQVELSALILGDGTRVDL